MTVDSVEAIYGLVALGFVHPKHVKRNADAQLGEHSSEVTLPAVFAAEDQALLTDPQTSGGLLVSCAPSALDEVLAVCRRHGFEKATVIGTIAARSDKPRVVVN
jgi:selenide,water dikinase